MAIPPRATTQQGTEGLTPAEPRRDRALLIVAVFAVLLVAGGVALFVHDEEERDRIPTYGPSMVPTITGDQPVEVEGDAYESSAPAIGDIVVLQGPAGLRGGVCGVERSPRSPCPRAADEYEQLRLLKRVVAGPGDRVAFAPDGSIIRNGELQDEDYIRLCPGTCSLPVAITVPPDHYFVAGDNRAVSSDSRDWGAVPRDAIDGRVKLVE